MKGIILDLSANQVYLEVDEQIRFRSPWIARPTVAPLHIQDRVDFAFSVDKGRPCVIIQAAQPLYQTGRAHH